MAVYRGPKGKIERRFNDPIFGHGKALQKKSYPPGQHGRMRRKRTEYALQFMEKKKTQYIYGILAKPLANLFQKAARQKGVTGEILLQRLEARLDNTIYRLGIAPTRRAARQLVLHKHIHVNSKTVNIPSYMLKVGDLVGVCERSKELAVIKDHTAGMKKKYAWLEWDEVQKTGKVIAIPTREEIPEKINEQSIVELYSK